MTVLIHLEQMIIYPYGSLQSSEELSDVEELLVLAARGSYVQVLQSDLCQKTLFTFPEEPLGDLSQFIKSQLQSFLENNGTDAQYVILCMAVSCLQLYAQNNFTGPFLGPAADEVLYKSSEGNTIEHVRRLALNELLLDTEGVYSLMFEPLYLLMARIIFVEMKQQLFNCKSIPWWYCRYALIHQKIAEENSPILHSDMTACVEEVEQNNFWAGEYEYQMKGLFNVEVACQYLHYQNIRESKKHLAAAKDILGLEISLAGALGKRTKWQTQMIPQLFVKVQYKDKAIPCGEVEEPAHLPEDLPKDLTMNDDTRLEKITFEETDEDVIPSLTPLEQVVVLTDLQLKLRAYARDVQTEYELKAYISSLLQHSKNWCVQLCALLVRSRIEMSEPRAMHRSLCQIEELFIAVGRPEPSRFERLKLFYSSLIIPKWNLHQEVARMNMRLGNIKTALSIFEQLELWEDVIICNNELQFRSRSAAVIRKLLEDGETPRLLCLLGDATDEIEHYHRAWEISGHRSGKAQRCLGYYYYVRKNFTKAVEHYEISVRINSLQYEVWQRLAYSCLILEDWRKCSSAYIKCTVLEPDSFECWNNLSQAYLKLNESECAWKALKEALRCNTTNWRLWGNYMQVSTSLGYMGQAIHAYNQILTLKERHVDTEILGCIVKSVLMGAHDPAGVPMRSLYKKISDLLGQQTRQVPTNPELWFLSASLVYGVENPTQEAKHTAMQYYRRSIAAAVQKNIWCKEKETVQLVLIRGIRLMEVCKDVLEGTDPKTLLSELNSLKMLLSNALINIKNNQYEMLTGEVIEELRGPYDDLCQELNWLKAFILETRGS